ncbi:MAG: RNA-guided pseudouridylation complex pseudouridine synthase subunit Cbf5 [Candidatus Micrarchaeota archaeon]
MITLQREEFTKGKKPSERSVEERLSFGVVLIDKPCGPSSHEVSAFARKIAHSVKSGHSGTLDPDVSGVLPVFLNNACKAVTVFIGAPKEYVCVMLMGCEKPFAEVNETFDNFRGAIYQTPPLKSAVAKKLRVREVYSLDVLEVAGRKVLFKASVQGGTYIRTICDHFGEVIGCGASMHELRRTKAAGFDEADCVTLQDLSDAFWLWHEKKDSKLVEKFVHNLEDVLSLKKVVVSDGALKPITTGANLAIPGIISLDQGIKEGDRVQLLSGKGEIACLARALMPSEKIASQRQGIAFDVERVIQQFS